MVGEADAGEDEHDEEEGCGVGPARSGEECGDVGAQGAETEVGTQSAAECLWESYEEPGELAQARGEVSQDGMDLVVGHLYLTEGCAKLGFAVWGREVGGIKM